MRLATGRKTITQSIFMIFFLLATQRFAIAVSYSLDYFTGATSAYGINNNDVIVGRTSISNTDFAYSYDFLSDTFLDLSPQGTNISWAHAINDSGEIAGGGISDKYRAYYWNNGSAFDLTPTESYGANAIDLNEHGKIVGYSRDINTRESQAIVWDRNGGYEYLNSLSYSGTFARAINNNGQIVGTGDDGSMLKGLIWNDTFSDPFEIPSPDNWYREVVPTAINDSGDVVGYGRGDFWGHAFVYADNQFIDVHDSSLWEHTFAYDINESGQVLVGAQAYDGSQSILIWQDGIFENITPEDFNFFSLAEMNDLGHITGSGYSDSTHRYAFNARPIAPVPEPSTIFLLGAGLVGLARFGRRKS